MNQTVGIGIVSYAHLHAPRYAATIAAHPQARLAGIASLGVNDSVAQAEAERFGVPYFRDYSEFISQGNLDAIYIGSTPVLHKKVITQAVAQGIHILCDKPLATTLEDADKIVARARQANVKLMVPFNPRFQLPLIKIKTALDTGEAGDLVSIYAVKHGRLPTKAISPLEADWFLDPTQAGGGGFLDIGIHAIDALRWLAGAEVRRVHANVGTMIHTELATDDLGTMTVEFENGVVGVLSSGWANPDGFPTWLDARFEILTTRQVFLVKSPYHDFTFYSEERTAWWRRDVHGIVDDFIGSILNDREPAITGEDGRAALAIALAAYESARTGKIIDLSDEVATPS